MDENVDPAWTKYTIGDPVVLDFPYLGFGVPCWCGVGRSGPGMSVLLVAGFVHW